AERYAAAQARAERAEVRSTNCSPRSRPRVPTPDSPIPARPGLTPRSGRDPASGRRALLADIADPAMRVYSLYDPDQGTRGVDPQVRSYDPLTAEVAATPFMIMSRFALARERTG